MSELKVILATPHPKMKNACDGAIEVYSKSEADKVFADLEESHKMEVEQLLIEIAELQKQVRDYAQGLYVIQARAEKEARHNKYKRCLAMAERCDEIRHQLAMRWKYRWRELAEKFKEAK